MRSTEELSAEKGVVISEKKVEVNSIHSTHSALVYFQEKFEEKFRDWLAQVRPLEYPYNTVECLRDSIHSAVENVYDHAGRLPLPRDFDLESSLTIQYLKGSERLEELFSKDVVDSYVRKTSIHNELEGVLEITVSDNGIGIPARQSQDLSIYEKPHSEEKEAFEASLKRGGSCKIETQDSVVRFNEVGFGFFLMNISLKSAGMFGLIRSYRSGAKFVPNGSANFEVIDEELEPYKGTEVSVLVPVHKYIFPRL